MYNIPLQGLYKMGFENLRINVRFLRTVLRFFDLRKECYECLEPISLRNSREKRSMASERE